MTAELQQQSYGVLGDGIGAVIGHIADGNALFPCTLAVSPVVAGGHNADKLHIGAGLRKAGRQVGAVSDDDIRIADAAHHLLKAVGVGIVNCKLAELFKLLIAQIAQIDDAAVNYTKLHVWSSAQLLSRAAAAEPGRVVSRPTRISA